MPTLFAVQPLVVHSIPTTPSQPPLLVRTLLGIATALAVYIGLCVAWLVGSTLVRRHSNGLSLSTQLTSSAKASPSASNAYAPKEYSKVWCVLWRTVSSFAFALCERRITTGMALNAA